VFLIFLWSDVVRVILPGAIRRRALRDRVDTLVIPANTSLLTLYTFSCHRSATWWAGSSTAFSCVASGAHAGRRGAA